jgi:hypothetical protein
MPNVKYQVFVSSTYEDLKEERDQVIKACLEMGHIPVGMEMFSAADEEQWKIITRQIDESDYYIVVIAHRYGSLVDGVSYTEKEYDYAIANGVPVLGFILDSGASWPSVRMEAKADRQKMLAAFKTKVRQKPIYQWNDKKDLHSQCAIALMKAFNTRPRPGWVRAEPHLGPGVAAELSRLSSENASLREQLATYRDRPDTSVFAQGDDRVTVTLNRSGTSHAVDTTWGRLFVLAAHAVLKAPLEWQILGVIGEALMTSVEGIADYRRREWKLTEEDILRLNTQFLALELITIQPVTMTEEPMPGRTESRIRQLWRLTARGERQLASLMAERRTPTK